MRLACNFITSLNIILFTNIKSIVNHIYKLDCLMSKCIVNLCVTYGIVEHILCDTYFTMNTVINTVIKNKSHIIIITVESSLGINIDQNISPKIIINLQFLKIIVIFIQKDINKQ